MHLKKKLQLWFINILVKHLFNAIEYKDILHKEGRDVMFRGKPMSKDMLVHLSNEADRFEKSTLWKILMYEIKWLANKQMFYHSKTESDMLFGKAMLFNIEQIEKKIDELKKLKF